MKRLFSIMLLITGLAFVSGCQNKHNPKPEKLLSKKEMVQLLTDMQLLEAELQQKTATTQMDSMRVKTQENYDVLFQKYGISKTLFEENLTYYTFEPKELTEMYNQVEKNIQKSVKKAE